MPRQTKDGDTDVPSTIARSEPHARHVWKKTHDSAVETYGEGSRAHRVAWASLKHSYEKAGDRWVPKKARGPSDPQAARGPTTRRKSTDEPRAPTARGKVAKTPGEPRETARTAKREYARGRRKRAKSGAKTRARARAAAVKRAR